MHKLTALLLTVIVGTSTLAGCVDDKPSASDWAAKVVKVCNGLATDREAARTATGMPTGAAPTVEQLMAFSAAFAPNFTSAVNETKALDHPSGMDNEIANCSRRWTLRLRELHAGQSMSQSQRRTSTARTARQSGRDCKSPTSPRA